MPTQSVLLTGWGCPTRLLEPLAEAMREGRAGEPQLIDFHDFPLQSASAERPDYAEDMRSSLRDVESPLRLIGWSTGALIALEFSIRYPDQVSELILMSATARFTATTDYPAGVPTEQVDQLAAAIASDVDRERGLMRFMAQAALPRRLDRATLRQRIAAALSLKPEALLAGFQYLRSTDLREGVAAIRCPVRIWHGAADAVIPVAAAEWLARHVPNADLHVEPEAGHDGPLQDVVKMAKWAEEGLGARH